MKNIHKRMLYSGAIALVGLVFIAISLLAEGEHRPAYLGGMGTGLLVVGILKVLQFWRFAKNPAKAREFEVKQKEERVVFIAQKSATMVFWLTIAGLFVAAIVCFFLNEVLLMQLFSYMVSLEVLLYFLLFYFFSRRY